MAYNYYDSPQVGNYSGALNEANQACISLPSDGAALYNRGVMLHHAGELEAALRDFNRACSLCYNKACVEARAFVKFDLRDYLGALEDQIQVTLLDPFDKMAWINRGMLNIIMNDPSEAKSSLKMALSMDPQDECIHVLLKLANNEASSELWFEADSEARQLIAEITKHFEQNKTRKLLGELAHHLTKVHRTDLIYLNMIGEGSYGRVFRAKWKGIDVAVKEFKHTVHSEQNDGRSEVEMLMQLRSPFIVLSLGYCDDPKTECLLLVSEYMEGGDLHSLIHTRTITARQIARIARDVASALHVLHTSVPAVIHRDLKPMNVLLDCSRTRAKVSDFGLATLKNEPKIESATIGSIFWMAPEVLAGKPYDEKADIYSFGIILYEMLTKVLPFYPLKLADLYRKLVVEKATPDFDKCPRGRWSELVSACCSYDPSERPTAGNVLHQIQEIMKDIELNRV